jgi:hypothetical protein
MWFFSIDLIFKKKIGGKKSPNFGYHKIRKKERKVKKNLKKKKKPSLLLLLGDLCNSFYICSW